MSSTLIEPLVNLGKMAKGMFNSLNGPKKQPPPFDPLTPPPLPPIPQVKGLPELPQFLSTNTDLIRVTPPEQMKWYAINPKTLRIEVVKYSKKTQNGAVLEMDHGSITVNAGGYSFGITKPLKETYKKCLESAISSLEEDIAFRASVFANTKDDAVKMRMEQQLTKLNKALRVANARLTAIKKDLGVQ